MYYADFVDALERNVPHVTDDLYEAGITFAVRQFARDTELFQFGRTISYVADKTEYDIGLPNDTVVVRLKYLLDRYGNPLESVSMAEALSAQMNNSSVSGFHLQGSTLYCAGKPRVGDTEFGVGVVLGIAPSATEIPAELAQRLDAYPDAIVYKAAAHILLMPNKPWTNRQAAADFEVMYQDQRLVARREAKGLAHGQVRQVKGMDRY